MNLPPSSLSLCWLRDEMFTGAEFIYSSLVNVNNTLELKTDFNNNNEKKTIQYILFCIISVHRCFYLYELWSILVFITCKSAEKEGKNQFNFIRI